MARTHHGIITLTIWLVTGCGAETPKPTRNAEIAADRQKLETYDDESTDSGSADATEAGSIFHQFCTNALATDIESTPVAENFKAFCNQDGSPTSLLTSKLPSIAYTPDTEVKLIQLAAPTHDTEAATTAITVATAAKLPVSAKHYFEMMSALMDDSKRAVALGVKLVDGQTKNESLAEYEGDDAMYFKGWKKHIRVETTVSDQLIVSEYLNHQDHWRLTEGSLYLMNSFLEESISGVVDGQMITAIIQGKSSAFLFTIIHTKTANRGLPSVALDKLIETYKNGIKNAYQNAVLTKDETP